MKLSAAVGVLAACFSWPAVAQPSPADWDAVLQEAKGQTVYWHAWGGDPRINDFIAWVGEQALLRHGVTVTQVKLASTADAVARVVSEMQAGQDQASHL